jgi:nucleoside-diphosphate-sugar epimerase
MFDPSIFRDKTVAVIGASGFLGTPLVRQLQRLGARVVAFSRSAAAPRGENTRCWKGDASELAELDNCFRAHNPEIVFHLTSDSRGGREVDLIPASLKNDVFATVNALCAATRHGVSRFVMTGSLEEPNPGSDEEATPLSPYAAAKWATCGYGRMFRDQYDLDVRIVRPFMTYGPGQKEFKIVPSTILSLLRDQPAVIGSDTRLVDWIYVDDLIDGMLAVSAAEERPRSTVDLGSGIGVTVGDVAREIARQIGKEHLLKIGDGARGREMVRLADNSAARLYGFEPRVSLSEGLAATISWFRQREGGATDARAEVLLNG